MIGQTSNTSTQIAYQRLATQLVDKQYGLVHSSQIRYPHPSEPAILRAQVRLPYRAHDYDLRRFQVGGSGAAVDQWSVQLSALCESVERYCLYADRADVVVDSYVNLVRHFNALHPDDCPLFYSDQYPAVGFAKFTPETILAWSWATMLPSGEQILIPTDLVYLFHPMHPDEKRLLSPISTGAACGQSAADATVRGLIEVVERDALMLMWLNQQPCPRLLIEPQSELGLFIEHHLQSPTLTVQLFWLPNDLQIPVCMAILLAGEVGDQRTFVGLAANLSAETAARKALLEALEVRAGIFEMKEAQTVIETPAEITSIHKHAVYYMQEDRTALLDFLLAGTETVALADLPDFSTGCPATDLQFCLARCAEAEQPVFVADLTKDDIRPINLRVVRVIMPKMLQITTHHQKPFLGNPRLYQIPVQLGWRDTPMRVGEHNRDPHPFI